MTWHDEHGARAFCPITWTIRVVPVPKPAPPKLTPAEEAALADLAKDSR